MNIHPVRAIAIAASLLLLAACGTGGGGGGGGGGGDGGAAPDTTAPAVVIQNLRDKGIVHTGFLVATVSDDVGVTAVEVSLDGGAYQPATASGDQWTFQLPTGTDTWRDGTAHTIAARAKDAAGNTGAVGTVTVRKGVNRDINGDGYEDLAVGAYGHASSAGRLYIFHSAGTSGVTATAAGSASSLIDGDASNDQFGISVALGDVNGDGLADVIAGAYGISSYAGALYVFHSRGSSGVTAGSTAVPAGDEAEAIVEGDAPGLSFAISVAAGDVNGDGYADVAAGTTQAAAWAGRMYVFHSRGASGVTADSTAIPAESEAESILQAGTTQYMGRSVAVGDVNGDGNADVVVGNAGSGPLYVFHSRGSSGVTADATVTLAETEAESRIVQSTNGIGWAVAVGDVNGDGYGDVVATSPNVGTATQGMVYIFHSRGGGGVTADSTQVAAEDEAESAFAGEADGDRLGQSVMVADVNGDGYGDAVVGAPGHVAGRVYVVHSAGAAGVTLSTVAEAHAKIDGEAAKEDYGVAVSSADLNGDGYADVIATVPGFNSGSVLNTGRAYVFHSRGSSGVTVDGSAVAASGEAETVITGEAADDYFGVSITESGAAYD